MLSSILKKKKKRKIKTRKDIHGLSCHMVEPTIEFDVEIILTNPIIVKIKNTIKLLFNMMWVGNVTKLLLCITLLLLEVTTHKQKCG